MEIRRNMMGVIAQMGKGAEVITGTVQVPAQGTGNVIINFGKSFSRYLYVIEMTDSSKQVLMQSGYNSNKGYGRVGIYPTLEINDKSIGSTSHLSFRVNPAQETLVGTAATAIGIDESSIMIGQTDFYENASANALYNGFTYNYTIVSLDNVQ